MGTLAIFDQTTGSERTPAAGLSFPAEEVSLKEIIRERVYQEVQETNVLLARGRQKLQDRLSSRLVDAATQTSKDTGKKEAPAIDWKAQVEVANDAFESGQIFVFVGDRQLHSLDDRVEVKPSTEVVFLRLVPLVGG